MTVASSELSKLLVFLFFLLLFLRLFLFVFFLLLLALLPLDLAVFVQDELAHVGRVVLHVLEHHGHSPVKLHEVVVEGRLALRGIKLHELLVLDGRVDESRHLVALLLVIIILMAPLFNLFELLDLDQTLQLKVIVAVKVQQNEVSVLDRRPLVYFILLLLFRLGLVAFVERLQVNFMRVMSIVPDAVRRTNLGIVQILMQMFIAAEGREPLEVATQVAHISAEDWRIHVFDKIY